MESSNLYEQKRKSVIFLGLIALLRLISFGVIRGILVREFLLFKFMVFLMLILLGGCLYVTGVFKGCRLGGGWV